MLLSLTCYCYLLGCFHNSVNIVVFLVLHCLVIGDYFSIIHVVDLDAACATNIQTSDCLINLCIFTTPSS